MRAILLIISIFIAYNLLHGFPEGWPIWLRAGAALVVVMIALPMSEKQNSHHNRRFMACLRKPILLDYLYIGIIIIAVEFLLLSIFTLGPPAATTLTEDLHAWVKDSDPKDPELFDAPTELDHSKSGNWLWDGLSQRPLPKSANKRPSNKPDIFIDLLTPQATAKIKRSQIYLKSFALDYFNGESWSIYQPSKFTIRKKSQPYITINSQVLADQINFPTFTYRLTQPYYHNGQNVYCAVHNPLRTKINRLTKVSLDTYLLPRKLKQSTGYNYISTSQPITFNQLLKAKTNIVAGDPDLIYLSKIPDYRLQQKITKLALTIPKSTDTKSTLLKIRSLIQSRCKYSLSIRNPGKLNAIENFLFYERTGYCEFFATATAMLCREHNIPSRIAFGWTGGKHYQGSNYFAFLAKNAHAWTEVYLENYGWVIFDTTPSEEIQATNADKDEAAPDIDKPSVFDDYTDYSSIYPEDESKFWDNWKIPAIIIGVCSLLAALLLALRQYLTPRYNTAAGSYSVSRPPRYLSYFKKICLTLGMPYQAGDTLQQNITKLKSSTELDDTQQQNLDHLLSYHYDITYRNSQPNKSTESAIIKNLKKFL